MTNGKQWKELAINHEIAYLRPGICLGSLESYSLEKRHRICTDAEASTAEVDAAMRADFESLPDFAKTRLLNMLGAPSTSERDWWEHILLNFNSLPDAPPEA